MTSPQSRIDRRLSASDRAGLVRVAFACAAVLFADSVCPAEQGFLHASIAYAVVALAFQLAIRRGFWRGGLRSAVMGLVDIAYLTYPVYQLGPVTSVFPFGYLLIPVVNAAASTSRSRVALLLAGAGSLTYTGLLALTGLGLLPHAPAVAALARATPAPGQLLASGTLVVMSVLLTTLIVLRQITALDRMNGQLAELSQRDELTGLYNRRQLFVELRHQLERVARGARCGVLMLDLDGFKQVNDRLGHEAGDRLLEDIARALAAETRSIDVAARYGGDEFAIVLPDLAPDDALRVADRVVAAIGRAGTSRFPGHPVTASVGVALCLPGDDLGSLLRRADAHAYLAKRAGGNRVAFTPEASLARSPPARPVAAPDAAAR